MNLDSECVERLEIYVLVLFPTLFFTFLSLNYIYISVVWNPWKEKAAQMSDFGDDEYPNMVCVEAGYVAQKKELSPGASFSCGQTLKAKI